MASTTTSHCWRGRSTSISANLPCAESSEDMFDFVFGDQKYPSNMSSPESMVVVSRLPRKEACGAETGIVVGKPEFPKRFSATSTTSVSSSLPRAESVKAKLDTVVSKPQNDISIFATPLSQFVLEHRQRRISRESEASSTKPQHPTCTIIEEGREWYGYRDEGIRQAAAMFGVTGPWIRPGSGTEDVDGINGIEGEGKGEGKRGKPFWHGNGRKVGVEERVQERWMCVGGDEFGIGEELVFGGEGVEGDGEGSEGGVGSLGGGDGDGGAVGRDEDRGERKWWGVRWKNLFRMLGCGVLPQMYKSRGRR